MTAETFVHETEIMSKSAKTFRFIPAWLFLLTVFLFASNLIFAERLPVKIYTSADGLGSGFVDSIYRDSRGFMWFSTRDGLSRFDGSRFVTYQIGEKDTSPGVENIYETRAGIFWISTTGGSYRFNPNGISPPDSETPRLNAEHITNARGVFFEDSAGNLWLGTNGLYLFEQNVGKGNFKLIDLKLPPKPNTTFTFADITESTDGSLWLNTSWGLVRRLPDGRIGYYSYETPVSSGNSSILVDKNGRLWLTRLDEILVIKPEPIESLTETGQIIEKSLTPTSIIELKPDQPVQLPKKGGEIFRLTNSVFVEKINAKKSVQTFDGNIWITSENYLLEFADGVLHLHSDAEGLPNVMSRMAEDAAGNLWIGGHAELARLDRNGLVTFGTADGTNSSRFFAINEGTDGTLYFVGRDFYLNRFDGAKFQIVKPQIAPNAQNLWTSRPSLLDSKGDWWILTGEKLYRFSGVNNFAELDKKTPTATYTTEQGLKSNGMFQIFEDSGGDIWVSTRGTSGTSHGLARLKKGAENFVAFTEADGLPKGKSSSAFAEDSFGNLWIGFYEGGAARFDGEKFTDFSDNSGLPLTGLISDLHIDKKGRLWLGSSTVGLIRLDDPSAAKPSFVYLTTENGLKSNNIRTITEDRFGRIYVGSARGVDRLSPDSGRVKHYSVSDGLAADFVVDSHCDKNGNLWFATNNGVSRLIPLPDEKSSAPRIFLGGLRIAGVEQSVSDLGNTEIEKGELAHTENNLQIEFFGLDFRAGESLRYQYKLEGADADWSAPTEQRTVTFANLSPADYRFFVRAVNSEGVVSENPAVVSFKILSPIWARWWFIALCILLVTVIVAAFYRYRLARLREINAALEEAKLAEEYLRKSREERLAELEKVRSRIATDLHDDIGASLTQIAILSEVAQAQSKNGASEPLTKITSVSNELVSTMSDIVWSINPAKDHLSDLTQRMRRFASDVLSAREIGFQFLVPESNEEITVNTNLRREVFLIFKESINNIVKHSDAKHVEIQLKISEENLILKINDDGKGFVTQHLSTTGGDLFADEIGGNGILNMQKRASEMSGEVEIISEIGKGTKILLTLPLNAKNNSARATQTGGDIAVKKV